MDGTRIGTSKLAYDFNFALLEQSSPNNGVPDLGAMTRLLPRLLAVSSELVACHAKVSVLRLEAMSATVEEYARIGLEREKRGI